MTKMLAISESAPDMSNEDREELNKLIERMQELTGCTVLMIHSSVRETVSEVCTRNQVDVSQWLMDAINLSLSIETAKQQLMASGEPGMIAVGTIQTDSESEDRPFASPDGALH